MNQAKPALVGEEDVGIYVPREKRVWLTISLLVAVFGCDFSFRSYSVALPSIIANWTYSTNWYSAGNTLCTVMQTIMTIVVAGITAKKGLRKTMSTGLIIVAACSIATIFAPNMTVFLIIRMCFGVGFGMVSGQIMAAINLIWPSNERSKWSSLKGITYGCTNVVGPTLAGLLVDYVGWQSTYLFIFTFNIIGLIMIFKFCPRNAVNRFYVEKPFDLKGTVAFATSMLSIILVASMGNKLGWTSSVILFGIGVVVVSVILLCIFENKAGDNALLPWNLLKTNRNFLLLFCISILATIVSQTVVTYMPLYMQKVANTSATASGLPFTVISLVSILFTWVYGRITGKKFSAKAVLLFCALIETACTVFMGFWMSPEMGKYMGIVITYSVVYGIGRPINVTCMYDTCASAVPTESVGIATSSLFMGQTLGASVGVAVLQLIMNIWTDKYDLDAGLRAVFVATMVLGVLLCACVLLIQQNKKNGAAVAE